MMKQTTKMRSPERKPSEIKFQFMFQLRTKPIKVGPHLFKPSDLYLKIEAFPGKVKKFC